MADNKMLIDAAHPEETRVAMVRGNRVDEFDFESEHKTQLRGNIYLAKVTRVEPSLQAAFVDYGGNRHGFLAFSEIHPDYYQIPIADRQALLAAEEEEVRTAAEEETADDDAEADADEQDNVEVEVEAEEKPKPRKRRSPRRTRKAVAEDDNTETTDGSAGDAEESDDDAEEIGADNDGDDVVSEPVKKPRKRASRAKKKDDGAADSPKEEDGDKTASEDDAGGEKPKPRRRATSRKKKVTEEISEDAPEEPVTETKTGDAEAEDKPKRRSTRRRKAPVAEKGDEESTSEMDETAEDTDNKGDENEDAKADEDDDGSKKKSRSRGRGRSRRGKGRKNDAADNDDDDDNGTSVEEVGSDDAMEEVPTRRTSRRNYKIQEVIKRRQILLVQVVKEERGNKGAALTTYLSLAGRYSVLMPNTARGGGISRKITNAADRKRLKSIASGFDVPQGMGVILRTAGASRKPEEIQRDFEYLMRMWESVRTLTLESTAPCLVYEEGSLIKRSIRDLYDNDTKEILVAGEAGHREAQDFMTMLMPEHAKKVKLFKDRIPLFAKMGVETQLDAMLQPQVTLKSGGYIIIDQTEALVSIDVNSGKSTRQHSVEETATQTNLEAADEIARQLRLRDLAGLIVIDFIDMDERRNNRNVENRLKNALKNDRARIQVGRISHFGLMEMSRQRIRASVLESTTQVCPTCEGLGHVRSPSSVVLAVLRAIEEQLNKSARNDLTVRVSTPTALYLLNNKRDNLSDLEQRFGVNLTIEADNTIGNVPCVIEKGEPASREPSAESIVRPDTIEPSEAETASPATSDDEGDDDSSDGPRKKRRRRRRGKGGNDQDQAADSGNGQKSDDSETNKSAEDSDEAKADKPPRSRRSRRNKAIENDRGQEADEKTPEAKSDDGETASEEGKPKRSTRRRKAPVSEKPVEQADSEPAAEPKEAAAVVESDTVSEDPKEKPKRSTVRRKAPTGNSAPETTSAEPPKAEKAAEPEPAKMDSPEDPSTDDGEKKKGGWWQRKFF